LFSLLFSIVGCASQGTSISQGASATQPAHRSQTTGTVPSRSDRADPPILLRDPSPGQLEVYINVTIGGYERTTREQTTIGLSFASNGRLVQFAGHERLTCNGTSLPLHNRIAVFQVAEAPTSTLEGHPFSCAYSAGGTSATLMLAIPSAPVICSPQDFAQVPRSPNTLITYEVRGGKLLGIVALGPGAKAIAHLDTPRLLQATVNTSAFTTGAGSLSLTQMLDLQVTRTGTPFKSLGAGGTTMTMVAVTWV
jgi:hypothetical protein